MSRTHWFSDYKKRVRELQEYATALERREAKLISALELASQGYQPTSWTGSASAGVQRLAAKNLAEIAMMPRPERPYL